MALGRQFVNDILGEDINKSDIKHTKGVFTEERNYKIACRFYYHHTLKGLRYERCLVELNKEFNLSEIRIAQIVMTQGHNLKLLKNNMRDKRFFANAFPYLNWS